MATSDSNVVRHPRASKPVPWRIVDGGAPHRAGRRSVSYRAVDQRGQSVALARYDGPDTCKWVEVSLEVAPGTDPVDVGAELLQRLASTAREAGVSGLVLEFNPEHRASTEVLQRSGLSWQLQSRAPQAHLVRGFIDCRKEQT